VNPVVVDISEIERQLRKWFQYIVRVQDKILVVLAKVIKATQRRPGSCCGCCGAGGAARGQWCQGRAATGSPAPTTFAQFSLGLANLIRSAKATS